MIKVNIEKLLKQNKRSKYWLCQRMNITSRNLNRIIRGETTSISFKYIEEICFIIKLHPWRFTYPRRRKNKRSHLTSFYSSLVLFKLIP